MFPQLFDKQKLETPEEMHTEAIVKKVFDRVMKSLSDDLQKVSTITDGRLITDWWPTGSQLVTSWWPVSGQLLASWWRLKTGWWPAGDNNMFAL